MKFSENKYFGIISLFLMSLVGIGIRIYEVSNWKLYSDSFKFLLIAKSVYYGKNIISLYPESDFGTYPSIFVLYKWLYGILIGLSVKLTSTLSLIGLGTVSVNNHFYEIWAHFWVIVPSVFCIVLVGMIAYEVTKSKRFGLIAAILLAFSGTTIIWNSFIVTEPITIFLFLLLILWDLKYSNIFLNIVIGILVGLARPEFYFAAAIYIVLSFVLRRFSFKTVSKSAVNWINKGMYLIAGLIYVYVFLFSSLYKTNIYGDLFIFVSTLLICIHAVVDNRKDQVVVMGLNEDPLALVISKVNWLLLIVISFLSLRYYTFNADIERYVVVLIPLLILLNINYWYLNLKVVNWKLVSLVMAIVVMLQLVYVLSFPKYLDVDYHTELARRVIDYARSRGISNIYVAQSDPFVYENTDDSINIYELSNGDFAIIQANSLVVKDPSLPYRDVTWKSDGLELVDRFTTKALFWVNNLKMEGNVELWAKK